MMNSAKVCSYTVEELDTLEDNFRTAQFDNTVCDDISLSETQSLESVVIDMSLSSGQSLEDINYRRDSFSDRVCDDLSEVILQFLPIKDKFRFECVGKQFQRTVYQRNYELNITVDIRRKDVNIFETILKKLSNIKSLKCLFALKDEEIDVIIKNCNHLIELNIDLNRNSTEIRKSFADRFGPQLTSITLNEINWNNWKLIVDSLVVIQEIDLRLNLRYLELRDLIDFYTHFKPKNLKKISLSFDLNEGNLHRFSDIQKNDFKTFIDNNKSVTHLSLKCEGMGMKSKLSDYLLEPNLRCISRLNELISLRIETNIKSKSFIESLISVLNQLAVNCPKLKSLSLGFIEIRFNFQLNDFMSEINKFKELKRFEFKSDSFYEGFSDIEEYFVNSLKTSFQDLTHLTLDLVFSDSDKNFLDNIDINKPKLQKLIIRKLLEVSERTIDFVSQLSKLSVLELNIKTKKSLLTKTAEKEFLDSFEKKILQNSRKIKSIKIFKLFR